MSKQHNKANQWTLNASAFVVLGFKCAAAFVKAPLFAALVRQAKLDASYRVQVPVG
ncbi:hypothetical protein [Vibrio tritonius]|uniref:hypothetical protein n=1 Tax=Vibrio tritonius TaxID=1435069 RepID=UPI000B0275D3|nr:hypothetical protein [Vibrio tritonius]